MRRMDRYNDTDDNSISSLEKNQELYQNFSHNTVYTNVKDIIDSNTYEIDPRKMTSQTTREDYQKLQKYQGINFRLKEKKELEEFNYFYPKRENKIYDINSVLEEARKARQGNDEQDERRKLKNDAYNILTGISKKELEEYREEKRKRMLTPEEEEIRELIDTIASKTLAGEIDKATSINLLSDLMATSVMDKVGGMEEEASTNEIESKEEKQILNTKDIEMIKETGYTTKEMEEEKDNDFYTKSMDLSDKDFNISDEFKEKPLPIGVKLLIFLVIISVLALTAFFIYKKMF